MEFKATDVVQVIRCVFIEHIAMLGLCVNHIFKSVKSHMAALGSMGKMYNL